MSLKRLRLKTKYISKTSIDRLSAGVKMNSDSAFQRQLTLMFSEKITSEELTKLLQRFTRKLTPEDSIGLKASRCWKMVQSSV